jgi:hypothetical protein
MARIIRNQLANDFPRASSKSLLALLAISPPLGTWHLLDPQQLVVFWLHFCPAAAVTPFVYLFPSLLGIPANILD